MKDKDVLLRAEVVLNELYDKINTESWAFNKKEYDENMNDFFIITNLLGELIQHRYNKHLSKEEFKRVSNNIIDHFFRE